MLNHYTKVAENFEISQVVLYGGGELLTLMKVVKQLVLYESSFNKLKVYPGEDRQFVCCRQDTHSISATGCFTAPSRTGRSE